MESEDSLPCSQTSHPVSYKMDTEGSFIRGKVAGAWSWQLTSFLCQGQECVALYRHHQYVFMAWFL